MIKFEWFDLVIVLIFIFKCFSYMEDSRLSNLHEKIKMVLVAIIGNILLYCFGFTFILNKIIFKAMRVDWQVDYYQMFVISSIFLISFHKEQ